MQTSFASILFAAAAILPSAMASPTGSTLEARKVALPAANQAYLCNTQKNSAGTSNIREGINKLKTMNTKDCAPGDNGKEVRMIKGDGYSFYIGSTGGVKTGNWKCNTLEDPFVTLANSCGGEVDGDYRAGGVVWVPGYEGKSYIYATNESY
ncbi:hypothetical protein F4821DRAFT_274659 [Hypoxylon rubiginosum]|uniref:Uncharacterized protein n=1 Tax=Hypoxylon rubiginosum TaxID=110542 RepID=A0ACC0CMK4_9PEZI|nr:hypothetical protein F4821DRAFT_274659 [Hypoxylon rubiginosum]